MKVIPTEDDERKKVFVSTKTEEPPTTAQFDLHAVKVARFAHADPRKRVLIYCGGRGAGFGRGRDVGVALAVGTGVAVGVGVGVGAAAQYLPLVFN